MSLLGLIPRPGEDCGHRLGKQDSDLNNMTERFKHRICRLLHFHCLFLPSVIMSVDVVADKMAGPSYLYKSYMGDVPWNAMMDWLSEDRELFAIVTKAFRSVSLHGDASDLLSSWLW